MKVTIVGCGYVGIITGVCLAVKGHEVICVDKNPSRVDALNRASCPIYEKGLENYLRQVQGKSFRATTDLASAIQDSDIVMVTVGTPTKGDAIDLSDLSNAVYEIGHCLRNVDKYVVVAIKSTVIPGTIDSVVLPLLKECSGKNAGQDFDVCMNPEFLREGNAISDSLSADRIVVGASNEKCHAVMRNLYDGFGGEIVETTASNAEMTKYTSNALLATLISFSNEMANICARSEGLDIVEVMRGVHLDHRLNPILQGKRVNPEILHYLMPSSGFGGSCFPKDIKAMISYGKEHALNPRLLTEVLDVNARQIDEVIRLLKTAYADINGLTIGVLGLTFKPGTDDLRESSALKIIDSLLANEVHLKAYDPLVTSLDPEVYSSVACEESWEEAVRDTDAVIIATPWAMFREISEKDYCRLMKRPVIVDVRRILHRQDYRSTRLLGIGYGGEHEVQE